MSQPNTRNSPKQTPYTGGELALMGIGAILLLPGLCSLFVMISMVPWSLNDPFFSLIATGWLICLLIAAGGAWIIYAARKRVRNVNASNARAGTGADSQR